MNIKNILLACVALMISLPLIASQSRKKRKINKQVRALTESQARIKRISNKEAEPIIVPEEELVVTQEEINDTIKMIEESKTLKLISQLSGHNTSQEEIVRKYLRDKKAIMYRENVLKQRKRETFNQLKEIIMSPAFSAGMHPVPSSMYLDLVNSIETEIKK